MANDAKLKEKIMNEGFPLQRYCSILLRNTGWEVDEEYPVQWNSPPTPDSRMNKTTRTSGDVRAVYPFIHKDFAIQLCISCKRQLSIDWVFMRSMFTESTHFFPRLCAIKSESGDYKNSWEYEYGFENNKWPEKYYLCNIPTTLTDRTGKNRDDDKILQTADNLYFELSQSMDDYHQPLSSFLPYSQIIYIPVIVTGAEISIYDIDEKKFSVDNSECINTEKVPYLLYRYRLPISMQRMISSLQNGYPTSFDKMNIFVVYYKHFQEFVNTIKEQFKEKTITLPTR